MNSLLAVKSLKKRNSETFCLHVSELNVSSGSINVLMGSNGAGKTTLLKVLGLLVPPTKGSILFAGKPYPQSPSAQASLRKNICFVAHNPYMFKGTVWDNVLMGARLRGSMSRQTVKNAKTIMEQLDLTQYSRNSATTLSAGSKQRLALARALLVEPQLYLLDEPFANMDVAHISMVKKMLEQRVKQQTAAIFYSTHSYHSGLFQADQTFLLSQGRCTRLSPYNHYPARIIVHNSQISVEIASSLILPIDGYPQTLTPCSMAHLDPHNLLLHHDTNGSQAPGNRIIGLITSVKKHANKIEITINCGVEIKAIKERAWIDEKKVTVAEGQEIAVHIPPQALIIS